MIRRILLTVVTVAGLAATVMLAQVAQAAPAPPGPPVFQPVPSGPPSPQVTLWPAEAEPGEKFMVAGEHFEPGEDVNVYFDGAILYSTIVSAAGSFAADVEVPAAAVAGATSVEATGSTGSNATASFNVLAATPPPSTTAPVPTTAPGPVAQPEPASEAAEDAVDLDDLAAALGDASDDGGASLADPTANGADEFPWMLLAGIVLVAGACAGASGLWVAHRNRSVAATFGDPGMSPASALDDATVVDAAPVSTTSDAANTAVDAVPVADDTAAVSWHGDSSARPEVFANLDRMVRR